MITCSTSRCTSARSTGASFMKFGRAPTTERTRMALLHCDALREIARPIHVAPAKSVTRSEEHTSELQSPMYLVCRLLLEKKKYTTTAPHPLEPAVPAWSSPAQPCASTSLLMQ